MAVSDPFNQDMARYSDAIITRSIADGSLQGMPTALPTQNRGVHEIAAPIQGAENVGGAGDNGGAVIPANGDMRVNATGPTTAAGVAATAPDIGVATAPSALMQIESQYRISLEEAIQRALRHSLQIKVEAYNPAIREARIVEAIGAFEPVLIGQSQFTNQDRPRFATSNNGQTWTNTLGIRKLLPSGGTVQVGAGGTYFDPQSAFTGNGWESNVNASIQQPLLRGFGANVTQANIYLAQKDYQVSLAQFRRQVIETVAQVEEQYYTLIFNYALVDIQQRLLTQSELTDEKIRARGEVDVTKIELAQSRAAVQARRADLVRAKAALRNASDRLKALMNDPQLDIRENVLLVPVEIPSAAPIAINVVDQIRIALRQRPEMQEARLNIERADIILDVARNDLLPRLNLTLSTQSAGSSQGLDIAFRDAVSDARFVDFVVGIALEMPIGNEQAEAVKRRRVIERKQAITQMFNIAVQVVLDVKLQMRDLFSSYQEIEIRREAREAAAQELTALIAREDVVNLTPEFLRLKLDAQQRLANAETQLVQTMVSYNLAIMRLEQAKGTLLEYNRVAIGPAPMVGTDQGKIRFLGQTYDLGTDRDPLKRQ